MGEIVDLGVHTGLVEKSGAWYQYNGEKIGQGREAAKQYLLDNPKESKVLEKEIRKIHKV